MEKNTLSQQEQLLALVKIEADNIRIHATKREIDKLDPYSVRGDKTDRCIYGQMTGDCKTARAATLIKLCATQVYIAPEDCVLSKASKLSSKPRLKPGKERLESYISPIEKYLFTASYDNITRLVKYIKGESEKLVLN